MKPIPFAQLQVLHKGDRCWKLHDKQGKILGHFWDYNWEIVGATDELRQRWPKVFMYSGNAYYVVRTWANENGLQTTEVIEKEMG